MTKSRVYMLAVAALALGVLFDYLFFEKSFGISVLIFETIAIILTLSFSARFHHPFRSALWLLVLVLFFAAMVAIRANLFLAFLNIVATAGLVLLATKELLKKHVINFRIPDYFFTIVTTPFKILRRSLQALLFLSRPSQKSSTLALKRVIIGILMALPFLVFFGVLFASADLAFKQLVDSVFRFQISDELFAHVILVVGTFVVGLGLFAYLFNVPPEQNVSETSEAIKLEKEITDRKIEVRVFLWLIAGLFAVFLVFQIAYLFGGAINISQGSFTYAEYARKGFWELLTVAFFSLVILVIMDKYTISKGARVSWFTIPSLVMIGEIFIIIISAFKRLMLYQSAYGLTTLRLYVSGFIIFLGVIFVILAIKLWSEKEDRFFAFGAFLSAIAFLVILNLLNPDAFVAKKNLQRFAETGNIDASYLGTLSADATPVIMDAYDRFNSEDTAVLRESLSARKAELERERADWQSYNAARHTALAKLSAVSFDSAPKK